MADYKWYEPPPIEAPDYRDRSRKLVLRASDDLTGARGMNFRKTPLFMVWAHLLGQLPPINAIGRLAAAVPTPTLMTLFDATACFQGVKRPHLKEDTGDNVLVYILKPAVTIEYGADMACVARALTPAVPFVLTVQVVLAACLQNPPSGVDGLVTRIEAVACDRDDDTLPVEYQERYRTRCW